MANTNIEIPTVALEASVKDGGEAQTEVKLNGEDLSEIQKNSGGNSTSNDSTEKRTGLVAGESKRTSSTTRPTLVQLGSSSTTAPQPKRFSAVNINKKFLEKNSPASAPSPSSQLTPLANSNASATRPQVQSTISHSRLVTAKLTSISPASSASAGWSRPSSAAPPNVPGSHSPAENSPRSANVSLGSSANASGAPQLPHAGKVIQPQPKSAITASKLSSDKATVEKSGKGVWGNVKMNVPAISNPLSDFPTAAEVAQGVALSKSNRQTEGRSTAEAAPPTNQAEADTFRGVHLDPNAHHWDEMEEDDDNFLDGVIEFGDGRQYKIEATETQDAASLADAALKPEDSRSNPDSPSGAGDNASIRKEDRFADDFDRSWPRSRPPPHPTREVSTSSTWSTGPGNKGQGSTQTHEGHSPTDAPRVLFNERSNRLEPYANSHRPHRTSFHDRDSAVSPSELRSPRDAPWGSRNAAPGQNEPSSRFGNRRFSSTSSTGSGSFGRDRDYTPTSPRIFKEPLSRDRESRGERPRRSDMGPPPVPPHAFKGDNRRQLPPHVSPVTPQQPLSAEHPSPRESRFQSSKPQGADPSYRSPLPPPSPALSHTSAAKLSPSVPTHILPSQVTPQLETVQKDYMHTAAERAKERRLQEEAERERERERAKQKAAELEARIKATESTNKEAASTQEKPSTQESEAVAFLEDAVKPVSTPEWGSSQRHRSRPLQRVNAPTPQEHSKLPDAAQPTPSSLPSKPNANQSHTFARSVSSEAQSWRTNATRPPAQDQASSDAKVPELSSNTAMDRVETLVSTSGTDLEVVDFSDMGKFLDGPDESASASRLSEKRPSRAVASDFFEDVKEVKVDKPPSTDEAETSWRSNKSVESSPSTIPEAGKSNSPPDTHPPSASARTTTFANDHHHPTSQAKFQRSTAPYKVAPMSALDDAMSRIKGALDGMHTASSETCAKSEPLKGRWVPPALRPRDHEMTETFSNTLDSLSISPLPLGSFKVSLPKISKPLKPIDGRRLLLFSKPTYVRWEVLSFDPPVEGMNKRDFTLNSLLFRRPMSNAKGPMKYRVNLPRRNTRAYSLSQGGKNGSNTFSRPAADGAISWRKSKDSSTGADSQEQTLPSVPEDDPCEPPAPAPASQHKPEPSVQFIRPRPLPKMPEGSGVAFYKDSRIDAAKDSKPSVSFFVASELESPSGSRPETPVSAQKTDVMAASKAEEPVETPPEKGSPRKVSSADNTIASWPPENTQSSGKPNHKGASISADSTPLKSRASWSRSSKDSSSRGPDPELLKAVWSQTSNKPGSHGVNSLEGIADDLTLPFTISEVKSEDGETPPPMASGPPSRMSLHEVTRAFQQPTTSSASSPRRSPPQVTNGSQQRNSNAPFSYQPPPPQPNNFRPGYPYPSPMMSHSPAPNMMYPAPMPSSPMPSRMQINGTNPPVYGQPMWMAPPGHQQPNGMMRPPVPNSPYHGPLVYPPSGPYAPGNLHPPAGQPTGQVNRDRNMPMVSPVMGHAGPAMYGSPVMMHAPMVPQNSGFIMPPAANHGPQRSENHQSIHQRGHAQPNSSLNYTQYERSGW